MNNITTYAFWVLFLITSCSSSNDELKPITNEVIDIMTYDSSIDLDTIYVTSNNLLFHSDLQRARVGCSRLDSLNKYKHIVCGYKDWKDDNINVSHSYYDKILSRPFIYETKASQEFDGFYFGNPYSVSGENLVLIEAEFISNSENKFRSFFIFLKKEGDDYVIKEIFKTFSFDRNEQIPGTKDWDEYLGLYPSPAN